MRLFALQREQLGRRALEVEVAAVATAEDVWRALVGEHPVLTPARAYVRFARNGVYVEASEQVEDGDELALIPPVAGGGPIALSSDPIDDGVLARMRRSLATPADGAVVTFLGQTRETPGTPAPGQEEQARRFTGQAVVGLEYEAFEAMALATLERIAGEVAERWGTDRVAIIHRTGWVPVGEASVAIAVAAPHRGTAFDACRYVIEELKARAPIWKSERYADGGVWIGAPARAAPEEADSG